jgi:hypothetical protein
MTLRDPRRIISYLFVISVLATVMSGLSPTPLSSASATNGTERQFVGSVVDATTGQPIANATILLLERLARGDRPTSWTPFQRVATVETVGNGSYAVSSVQNPAFLYRYRLYAYQNQSHTPGYDYLPVVEDVPENGELRIDFQLTPAASLICDGAILYVDAWDPTRIYAFTVHPLTAVPPGTVLDYGTPEYWSNRSQRHSALLGLSANYVLIPAQTPLSIAVHSFQTIIHVPEIGGPVFVVAPGSLLHVNLVEQLLPYNRNLTVTALDATAAHVTVLEQQGLYTAVARHDLRTAWFLVDQADSHSHAGAYSQAYGDLREAYLLVTRRAAELDAAYTDAANSVYIIVMFLAWAAMALASYVVDQRRRQLAIAALIYLLFLACFYAVYVGCHIVDSVAFVSVASAALVLAFVISALSARLSPQTVSATFSLAKRNLLRRKTRFLLTVSTVTLLVMAFVSLTSFTSEYNFVTTTQVTAAAQPSGTLLQHPAPDVPEVWYGNVLRDLTMVATFTPMTAYDVAWLEQWSNVTAVAPKVENVAFRLPFATLDQGDVFRSLQLRGILGVSAHETLFTPFEDAVVDGRFLQEGDTQVILLSTYAATSIDAQVGDVWTLRVGPSTVNVTVIGLFRDAAVQGLTDLNDAPLLPQKFTVIREDDVEVEGRIERCDPAEIIVMDWQTAVHVSSFLQISRINLELNVTDPVAVARQLAVTRDFWAYTVMGTTLHFAGSVAYYAVRGLSILVPWGIVILNVVLVMMNAMYERRHEVAILSAVGLNPSHVTAVFTFEAVLMGFIGGAVGYLVGQGAYRLLAFASIEVLVEQKVSAIWTLISLSVAIIAVVVGAMVALKASTVITPSLLRRWRVTDVRPVGTSAVPLPIPVRVNVNEVEDVFTYIIDRFHQHLCAQGIDIARGATRIHHTQDGPRVIKTLSITYLLGEDVKLGAFPFDLIARQAADDDTFRFEVVCKGPNSVVEETVRFLRWTIIGWSEQKHAA